MTLSVMCVEQMCDDMALSSLYGVATISTLLAGAVARRTAPKLPRAIRVGPNEGVRNWGGVIRERR